VPQVGLRNIRNFVCKGTTLDVHAGELLVLLGANGAGKTTLLNVIAGLVSYEGSVLFDGVSMNDVPARKRKVGYVFQELALFPHMDVSANIAYGLHNTKLSNNEKNLRVKELLDLLGIFHLSSRYPARLSGGEKQRVALARTLAPNPEILLLDEPFRNLDLRSSSILRKELKNIQRDLGTTTVFVTHDLAEAEELADRTVVIQDGLVKRGSHLECLEEQVV
jgi:ABC-type sulfate/molybdate transport systems ATPase subunit